MVDRQIKLLDQNTIDKIAAGEVVERPASVVKELVENSIDAGASAITIEIKNGGKSYIRVTDNGCGIRKEQLSAAFLRHATSKLRDAKELATISSLGFRGEALSSISAVSHVEMITKCKDELLGSKYVIEGANELSLIDVGSPDGTTIMVYNLFFNTPARYAFLKSDNTEGNQIAELISRLALSHPEISFSFINSGKEKLKTAGNNSLMDTIYQVYSKEVSMHMLPVDQSNSDYHITGFIGESTVSRGSRSLENFYVEHRYIKSSMLSHALEEGYLGYLMGHQYPFCVINIEPVAASVDVNVHPTKQEVRFDKELELCNLIKDTVSNLLSGVNDIAEIKLEKKEAKEVTKAKESIDSQMQIAEPFEKKKLEAIKERITSEIHSDTPYEKKYKDYYFKAAHLAVTPDENAVDYNENTKLTFSKEQSNLSNPFENMTETMKDKEIVYEQASFLSEEAKKSHRIIGQVFGTYWLVEYDNKLFIIDQHAAHEKVLYERMMKQLSEKTLTSQQLSPPIIVSLTSTEEMIVNNYNEEFAEVGYTISHFGGKEYAITSVPANLYSVDAKSLFLTMLAEFANDNTKVENQDLIKEKIASMSCKAAVKGNHRLSFEEASALIDELLTLENPYHCPHGRPTIISLSQYELEKKFRRIV